jgi:hypothetical protein
MRMPDPIGGLHMDLHRPFAKAVAQPYPGIFEIRSLIGMVFSRGKDLYGLPRLGKQGLLIEIAKTPDKMQ